MTVFSTIKGSPGAGVFSQLALLTIIPVPGKHFWGPGGAGDWPRKFEPSAMPLTTSNYRN